MALTCGQTSLLQDLLIMIDCGGSKKEWKKEPKLLIMHMSWILQLQGLLIQDGHLHLLYQFLILDVLPCMSMMEQPDTVRIHLVLAI